LFVLIVQLPGQKNKRRQERKTTEGFFLWLFMSAWPWRFTFFNPFGLSLFAPFCCQASWSPFIITMRATFLVQLLSLTYSCIHCLHDVILTF
jgi:hypothetical protein